MKTKITLFAMLLMSTLVVRAQSIMNIHQCNGTVLQIPMNMIDSITYTISNPGNLASLSTLLISNITANSGTSGGDITNDGGSPITQRGVVWGINPNPTTANSSTNNGSGTGNFITNLSGLTANTTYYVRAYATNSAGTAYGNELNFTTTAAGGGIVTNPGAGVTFDGYTYPSVVLGNGQEWMAENLRTSIYANGDTIQNVTDNFQWNDLTSGAWVHYGDASQLENTYGKLYNWYAVTDPRNVCPTGWHVPSDTDWTILTDYLGGVSVAGGKMKSTGTQYWQSPNTNATNESGFSGLPGGNRLPPGQYSLMGVYGYWWSSTEINTTNAFYHTAAFDESILYWQDAVKSNGFSIRCLRD